MFDSLLSFPFAFAALLATNIWLLHISRVDINHQGYYYLLLALRDTNES